MKGDILIIDKDHRKAGQQVVDMIFQDIKKHQGKVILTVAGESGAGKSEVASSIAELLKSKGIKSYVFQQDDYFKYPPLTNEKMRRSDINLVGMNEVKLDLLDDNIRQAIDEQPVEKPLVVFAEDRIDKETVDLANYKVLIAEGTYTTALTTPHIKIFIDRDHKDTRVARKKRNREKQDGFLEKVLLTEHRIIREHKKLAHILIDKNFDAEKTKNYGAQL